GDRAVGAIGAGAVEQRVGLALGVAAVAQLAQELVDEVAAVGEDQDAARARGLDEAHRRDGLARPRGVLETEALVGVGIVGRALGDVLVDVVGLVVLPGVLGLVFGLVVVLVVFVLVVLVVVAVGLRGDLVVLVVLVAGLGRLVVLVVVLCGLGL